MDILEKNNRLQLPWSLKIEKVTNGFIVSHYRDAQDDSGTILEHKELVTADEDKDMLRSLFYSVVNHFNMESEKIEDIFKDDLVDYIKRLMPKCRNKRTKRSKNK